MGLPSQFYERLLNTQRPLEGLVSVDETLQKVLAQATELSNAEGGSLFLYNPHEKHLVFYLVTGEKSHLLKGRTLQVGEGFAGRVAQTCKAELVTDAYSDSRFNDKFDTILAHRTQSLIAAPIIFGEILLGVLELVNSKNGKTFVPEMLRAVECFAECAAMAISASMKFRETKEDAERWKALFEMSARGDVPEGPLERIIARSAGIEHVKIQIRQVAVTPSTVLIRGETGTGKELVAQAIHELSPRRNHPFVRVNCGAIPASLIESELFGHEKGSFTGAIQRKLGRFELAHQGTIFLDEIGDLPTDLQVKLLRVLQQQEFERVGGTETLKVDVRVIAATHVDLEAAILEKKMRPDLYYRLNIFPIGLPPLRDRREDISILAMRFLEKHNRRLHRSIRGFSETVLQQLAAYDWPGNVRELESVIERSTVVCDGEIIRSVFLRLVEGLAPVPAIPLKSSDMEKGDLPPSLAEGVSAYKKHVIKATLRATGGNQRAAAQRLGMAPPNLFRTLKQLGIDPKIWKG